MARRRKSDVSVNYDGLTDSVTNLAGSLVLLVVLVVAVTRPKTEGREDLPPPENTPGAEQPMDQLLERIHSINAGLTGVTTDVNRVESRIPEIDADLEELIKVTEKRRDNEQ